MNLEIGTELKTIDKLGRESTFKVIEYTERGYVILEATGETLKRCEHDYKVHMKLNPESKSTLESFSRIEVEQAWFDNREISVSLSCKG